jgi:hypothetical protein
MQLQEEATKSPKAAVVEEAEEDSWQLSQPGTVKATTAYSFCQSSFRISKEGFYFLPTGLSRKVHVFGMFVISVFRL